MSLLAPVTPNTLAACCYNLETAENCQVRIASGENAGTRKPWTKLDGTLHPFLAVTVPPLPQSVLAVIFHLLLLSLTNSTFISTLIEERGDESLSSYFLLFILILIKEGEG